MALNKTAMERVSNEKFKKQFERLHEQALEFEAAIVEAKFSWLKYGDEHEDVSEYVPELVFRVKQVAGD